MVSWTFLKTCNGNEHAQDYLKIKYKSTLGIFEEIFYYKGQKFPAVLKVHGFCINVFYPICREERTYILIHYIRSRAEKFTDFATNQFKQRGKDKIIGNVKLTLVWINSWLEVKNALLYHASHSELKANMVWIRWMKVS